MRAAGVPWTIDEGGGPLVACAVHAGNQVRSEALGHMAEALAGTVPGVLDELDQLRAVGPMRRRTTVVA